MFGLEVNFDLLMVSEEAKREEREARSAQLHQDITQLNEKRRQDKTQGMDDEAQARRYKKSKKVDTDAGAGRERCARVKKSEGGGVVARHEGKGVEVKGKGALRGHEDDSSGSSDDFVSEHEEDGHEDEHERRARQDLSWLEDSVPVPSLHNNTNSNSSVTVELTL